MALSRVRSLESMQLKALPRKSLMVDTNVCQFYRNNFPHNPAYEPFDEIYAGEQEGWVETTTSTTATMAAEGSGARFVDESEE